MVLYFNCQGRCSFDSLDPPVVIMLEDEMLPEKYENKEVLWIETEAKHKVWPYSNRSWKRLRRKFTVISWDR